MFLLPSLHLANSYSVFEAQLSHHLPQGKKKRESVRKSGGEARGADRQSEGAGGRAGETGSGKRRGKTTWENRKEREDREVLGVRERTCGWMCE